MQAESSNKFVYVHKSSRGEIFYVGKGTHQSGYELIFEKFYRRAFETKYRSNFWKKIYAKFGREVFILQDFLTEFEAFEWEKFYIKIFGRRDQDNGSLVNFTDGGDGISGFKNPCSKETKQKIANALIGRTLSENHCINISLGQSEEKWNRQYIRSEELKEQLKNSPNLRSLESREKAAAKLRGRKRNPETIAKIQETKRKRRLERFDIVKK